MDLSPKLVSDHIPIRKAISIQRMTMTVLIVVCIAEIAKVDLKR